MQPMDQILSAARADPQRIVLPEATDPRIVEGALRASRDGLARIILVGDADAVGARLEEARAKGGEVELVDPATSPATDGYAGAYLELRRHKAVSAQQAHEAALDPMNHAALMVRAGDADGTIAGAVATTALTVRTAFQIIGRADGIKTVSSFFLMLLSEPHHPKQGAIIFADCGLTIEPSPEELAQIAISSADSLRAMLGLTPRIAFLSFSTMGSAKHKRVDRVTEALAIARAQRGDLIMDGEFQFDAAFVASVAASKAPDSEIQGDANVFVFPSLEAANIGYKIAQRIGGARAIGPVLQGLAAPANDLSRGCSAQDVYDLIAVTGAQAAASK